MSITVGQQAKSGHVVAINLLATGATSSEIQEINYSQCAPIQALDYFDLYQEWRIKSVDFRIIYPGEQDTPLCSVELAFWGNGHIETSAAPETMLMSNFDDYTIMPIPASHMVQGSINLKSLMSARGAVWSKWNSNEYYGKIQSTNTPFFYIRTNFFGTTLANQ